MLKQVGQNNIQEEASKIKVTFWNYIDNNPVESEVSELSQLAVKIIPHLKKVEKDDI